MIVSPLSTILDACVREATRAPAGTTVVTAMRTVSAPVSAESDDNEPPSLFDEGFDAVVRNLDIFSPTNTDPMVDGGGALSSNPGALRMPWPTPLDWIGRVGSICEDIPARE